MNRPTQEWRKRENGVRGFYQGACYAFNGLWAAIRHEKNFQVAAVCIALGGALGLLVNLAVWEWIMLGVCATLVLGFELVNSAIETLCDIVDPNYNPLVKVIKDYASAATCVASVMAALAGLFLIIPKLFPHVQMLFS